MKINWVLADHIILDPTVNIDYLKQIGSMWGSWQTWRSCQTDNVICHNTDKAQELIEKKFHTLCNFYIPNKLYQTLDKSLKVHAYGGDFSHTVTQHDELVAMNLAAVNSDIVLLLGFDWVTDNQTLLDYKGLVEATIRNNTKVQWVLLDQNGSIWSELTKLENLNTDTLPTVLKMLLS